MKKVSIVIPCYNEEHCIDKLYEELKTYTEKHYEYEFLFINDGSIDNTKQKILSLKNNLLKNHHIKLINFSKNFGHEAGLLCGLDYAIGDYVIFMDADLQHPPKMIVDILNEFNNGFNIISLSRKTNKDQNFISSFFSKSFYHLINKLAKTNFTENASDFFAIDDTVKNFLQNNYREKVRFMRGIVQNIGFKKKILYFDADKRYYGKSNYNFFSLVNLAIKTIASYSNFPLHLGSIIGFICGFMGIILLIYTFITRKGAPSGYATLIIFMCFMFAALFLILGIMGEYLAIMFNEIKDRPPYIVENIEGIEV